ncbi:hypothetical protein yruck0001_31200 [Yersinia ruckeri ATCC 29473]|nr:hypothetical protein yruck0001_31200 [Yersinia ruckeri ATCC 29473]CEK25738.1 hypothetical protein CSF007_p0290 [Yersinia ruckeri]
MDALAVGLKWRNGNFGGSGVEPQDQECGDLILTTAKSSIYSTTPRGTPIMLIN